MWFRRDLRADDHAALHHALRSARQVWCAFVFDRDILDPLPRADRRVEFIVDAVEALDADLAALGAAAWHARRAPPRPARATPSTRSPRSPRRCTCRRSTPTTTTTRYALARDARVRGRLADHGVALHTSKDHVVFERNEVLTVSGKPYGVFTPYMKAWLAKVDDFYVRAYPIERHAPALAPRPAGRRHAARRAWPSRLRPDQPRRAAHPARRPRAPKALLADFIERIDRYDTPATFPP